MPLNDNVDWKTVEGFGQEWAAFDQEALRGEEYAALFDAHFGLPLSTYRKLNFSRMRTDALGRFGTRPERFKCPEMESMIRQAGLTDIRFSERAPFWVACGIEAH